jgi:hypothetical protein
MLDLAQDCFQIVSHGFRAFASVLNFDDIQVNCVGEVGLAP